MYFISIGTSKNWEKKISPDPWILSKFGPKELTWTEAKQEPCGFVWKKHVENDENPPKTMQYYAALPWNWYPSIFLRKTMCHNPFFVKPVAQWRGWKDQHQQPSQQNQSWSPTNRPQIYADSTINQLSFINYIPASDRIWSWKPYQPL